MTVRGVILVTCAMWLTACTNAPHRADVGVGAVAAGVLVIALLVYLTRDWRRFRRVLAHASVYRVYEVAPGVLCAARSPLHAAEVVNDRLFEEVHPDDVREVSLSDYSPDEARRLGDELAWRNQLNLPGIVRMGEGD